MILPADPKASYQVQKDAINRAILEVLESGRYVLGPQVSRFESDFAAYLKTSFCIGVASGSDAVQLALRGCGVQPGDDVITVAHTAVATVSAIDWMGARPVLVDIDEETYTISPESVLAALRRDGQRRIRAIVAVHLYGHPANLDALGRIAEEYDIALVEDCAQAHGATHNGRRVGTVGICGAFSFYPTKNLGAIGDGGAVVTSDPGLDGRLRRLQQYGWRERYVSEQIGYNSRLDEVQAAILNCKLPALDTGNARRRAIAERYTQKLYDLPIVLPREKPGCQHVYHQYVIRTSCRGDLQAFLEAAGIRTAILYPQPIHIQPGYRDRVALGEGGLAVTERIAKEILSLPVYPELPDSSVNRIVAEIRAFFHA